MVRSKNVSVLGMIILQIALGAFFLVSGISTLQGGTGDEAASAIRHLVNGNLSDILCIVFGVIELLAGVILLLKLFAATGTVLDGILMFIIMLVWIVAIVLVDILGRGGLLNGFGGNVLSFFRVFASHLLILGAIFVVKN
jgi:uncharacterized membrane protein YphA (DoxX/SURF4 family)